MKALITAVLLAVPALGQDFSQLPDWARRQAEAAAAEPAPADADAWVLLQRMELAYVGNGEVRSHTLRLVKVLTDRGLSEATYGLSGLAGKASKVKKLKGWNLRPDGEVTRLNGDFIVTIQNESDKVTFTALPRAVKGSYLAFESEEALRNPMGPVWRQGLLEAHPVRLWELALAKREGWFTNLVNVTVRLESRNFLPWIPESLLEPGQSLKATKLPPVPLDEVACPGDVLPWVGVSFLDPGLKGPPSAATWDSFATWEWQQFSSRLAPSKGIDVAGQKPLEGLQAIHRWMCRDLTYKQVYLAPERGWIPEPGPEVFRKRYGDCKDLASLFMGEARTLGLACFPVLARMSDGRASPDSPVGLSFDHVIAAIRLEASLGLAAELDTPKGRFLLVDPTDRFSPLGQLHTGHLGRQVLICTDQGGIWVTIPASAILIPELKATLDGTVDRSGAVTASLHLQEIGDAMGLRSKALLTGPASLVDFLRERHFDVSPTGKLEVTSQGDPLDLDRPFEVVVKLHHPKGFVLAGGEGTLVDWGLPGIPVVLQKAGKPRHFPVELEYYARTEFHATWHLPWPVQPVLEAKTADTPFRRFTWKAEAFEDGGTPALRLDLKQERKPARFGFEARTQAVEEWKKDRAAMQSLVEDGLAFKVGSGR